MTEDLWQLSDGGLVAPPIEGPVAVIQAVYAGDDPRFLRESLLSLERQSVGIENIHIYLGVDGPVSSEINGVIEEHERFLYRIIRSAARRGLAATLKGLIDALEDEEFVFRMDSDDISHRERFERQRDYLIANATVLALGTATEEIDHSGIRRARRIYPPAGSGIVRYVARASPLAHPRVCFRRTFFDKAGAYDDRHGVNEDIELWFRALELGVELGSIPVVLYQIRVGPGYYRRRGSGKAKAEFLVYWCGIRRLHGWSLLLIWPVIRLFLRLTPGSVTRWLYQSRLRAWFLNRPSSKKIRHTVS